MATKAGRDSRTQAAKHPSWWRPVAGGVELALHVQPGARHAGLMCFHGNSLKVAVGAPASDGRANEAVLALLADLAGVPRRAVQLISGAKTRDKRVRIATTAMDDLSLRLGAGLAATETRSEPQPPAGTAPCAGRRPK